MRKLRAPETHQQEGISRRQFLSGVAVLAAAVATQGCKGLQTAANETVIDIHQHVGYAGRPNDVLFAHQKAMGVNQTILLPAGREMHSRATNNGAANGLQAKALGNEPCYAFAKAHPGKYLFAANEVPDCPEAIPEIEKYLALGGVAIAEQKFGLDCDAPEMQRLYQLATDHDVPVLMHWQYGTYNHGFERFYKMLEKYPRTRFIGHAQTWWANIDKNHVDQKVLYPKGKVTPGGITDRYLADYPNMYGDMSAGSGLNALTRDENHAREFIKGHQDKLIFGSDCNDHIGSGQACSGSQMIAAIRRLSDSREIERKLLCENARKVFKI